LTTILCEFCKRKFADITKHLTFCVKNPDNQKAFLGAPTIKTIQGKAKFERPYYIWENGKKTHMRFIQKAIMQSNPLPIGFYEAAKNSTDKGIQKLYQVAKSRKLEAKVEMLDTRQ
jgi:hypothetical protein